jgi:hypothetical protein
VNNKKWRKWCKIISLFYIITILSYLCSQRTANDQFKYFMFDWSIYNLFVLNRGWKRDSLQIMIFVYICSTLGIDELKTRFDMGITRNVVNGVCLCHYLSNNTYGFPVLTKDTKCPSHVFYDWFVDLQIICAKSALETRFPPNDDMRKDLFHMKHSWTK